MNQFAVWMAQGFGVGRIGWAPGTWGSLVGFLWLALLLATHREWAFVLGMIGGSLLAVWICGTAEKVIKQTDPSSVVLDEIIAVPFCYLGFITHVYLRTGVLPEPDFFLHPPDWPLACGGLIAFRVFDIIKPWPIRQSQSLPGGWGITVDDLLAAAYVNLVILVLLVLGLG